MNRRHFLATIGATAIAGCSANADEQATDQDEPAVEYDLRTTCHEETGNCFASLDVTTMPESVEYLEVKTVAGLSSSGSWITRRDGLEQEIFVDREQPRGDVDLGLGESIIIEAVTDDGNIHVLETHEFSKEDLEPAGRDNSSDSGGGSDQ